MKRSGSARALGVDFGTSNSAAALVDDAGQVRMVPLQASRNEMPTAVFFSSESNAVLFGATAVQAYLSGTEGRLLRSLKSLLGSALMHEYTEVNGRSLRYFDIVVLFLRELKARSEAYCGTTLSHAVLGRPVHFVDEDPGRDALAQETLGQAAREAGFTHIDFQLEPIAAALDYEQRLTGETSALIVDIGGGTSDFSVLRLNPARSASSARAADILATTGIHTGGTDFDRLLDLLCVMPLLGHRHTGPSGRPVPSSVFFDLSTWHLIHQAYTRKALHFARELWTDYADQTLHARLMLALQEQHGHRMLAAVEHAKIACSVNAQVAPIALDFLETGLSAELEPQAMAQALAPALAPVLQCARDCVAQSGLDRVDLVYLTGGSSALAPWVQALQTAMPWATLVHGERFGGVAAGLAVAGARDSVGTACHV